LSPESLNRLGEAFHAEHLRIYGHADQEGPVEIVNARVVQSWAFPAFDFKPVTASSTAGQTERRSYFEEAGGYVKVPVRRRDGLEVGMTVDGPAIIEQFDSTLVVYPGHQARLEASGNLIVTT